MGKLSKLIKYHFSYLFTKATILILIITVALVLFFNLFTAISFDNRISSSDMLLDYYMSSYTIIKLLLVLFIIFLFGYSFISNNDEYRAITITKKVNRYFYFVSKVLTLSFVYIFLGLLLIAITLVIALAFNIVLSKIMIESFFILLVTSFYYGFISILLVLLFDNVYVIFLVFPLSLLKYDDSTEFLCYFLPINYNNDYMVISTWRFSIIYYIFINFMLFMILVFIWGKKDLQN